MSRNKLQRVESIAKLQAEAERAISPLARPGFGVLVVITEVDRGPGESFKAMVSVGVAEHSVPKLLESALKMAREQAEKG